MLRRHETDDSEHPTKSQKYELSLLKQPPKTMRQQPSLKRSLKARRRQQEYFEAGSYDLSAFFTFRDDPDSLEVDTLSTEDISRSTTPYSMPSQQDQLIRFDFDHDASFDLGLTSHGTAAAENYLPHSIFFKPDTASEVTTSFALGRGDTIMTGKVNILEKKLLHLRKKITSKSSRKNPHNEYIADRYNTDRIQRELDMLDMPPENDATGPVKTKSLHKGTDHFEVGTEGAMSMDIAVDDTSTIAGYSLRVEFAGGSDSEVVLNTQLKSEENHVSFVPHIPVLKSPKQSTSKNIKSILVKRNESEIRDNTGVYIPHEDLSILAEASNLHDGRYPHVMSQPNRQIPEDDALSINNALAVKRFISAPRLCEGTKAVPSVVIVERTDHDYIAFAPSKHDASSYKESVFQPKEEDKDWKRVKSHMDQLPYIMKLSSAESEGNTLNGTNSRGQSFSSPVGVDQFNERRPWRKPHIILETQANISKEEELIRQLKSRVEMLISQAIPTDINIDKRNIVLDRATLVKPSARGYNTHNPSVKELKSRLRRIEATHSKEENCEHIAHTHSSILKIKARLRKIERGQDWNILAK